MNNDGVANDCLGRVDGSSGAVRFFDLGTAAGAEDGVCANPGAANTTARAAVPIIRDAKLIQNSVARIARRTGEPSENDLNNDRVARSASGDK